MNHRSESQTLPDGTLVARSYRDEVLHRESRIRKLPSGKRIDLEFNGQGELIKESHGYGLLAIQIERHLEAGRVTSETYFVRRRVASRRSYEKARASYADMPASDDSLEDSNSELIKAVSRERRETARQARRHQPDPARGAKLDAFCEGVMRAGRVEDAATWLQGSKNTLGVRDRRASTRLIDRLLKLGCARVYACEIDEDVDGRGNTGHLVAELPNNPAERAKLFQTLRRLAAEQGLSGDADDGQRFAYIKLD